jgi:hypothetical protein
MESMMSLPALLFSVAVAAPPAAPADEYFGPFRVSAISVRVTIDKLGRAYHAHTKSDRDILHEAVDAESGLRLWRHA